MPRMALLVLRHRPYSGAGCKSLPASNRYLSPVRLERVAMDRASFAVQWLAASRHLAAVVRLPGRSTVVLPTAAAIRVHKWRRCNDVHQIACGAVLPNLVRPSRRPGALETLCRPAPRSARTSGSRTSWPSHRATNGAAAKARPECNFHVSSPCKFGARLVDQQAMPCQRTIALICCIER